MNLLISLKKNIWVKPNETFAYSLSLLSSLVFIVILNNLIKNPDMRNVLIEPNIFPFQHIMYLLFFLGLGGFYLRWRDAKQDQRIITLYYQFINENKNKSTITNLQRKFIKQNELSKNNSFFIGLLDNITSKFENNEHSDQVWSKLNTNIDLIIQKIELKYNILKFLIWFIPTLGFIGTVIGIALALNRISPDSIEMKSTMDSLAFSFNTTMIALALSSIIVYLLHIVHGNEEKLFINACHSIINDFNICQLKYLDVENKNSIFIILRNLCLFIVSVLIIFYSSDYIPNYQKYNNNISQYSTSNRTWIESITGMEFVFIKGDTYVMGNTFSGEKKGDDDEIRIKVNVKNFWIAKHEVTIEQWIAIMGNEKDLDKKNIKLPVNKINWDEANLFISKLNEIYKKNSRQKEYNRITFRLPKEHEWEFACREGGNPSVMFGDGSLIASAENLNFDDDDCKDNNHNICIYTGLSTRERYVVGTLGINKLGIADLSGNVGEWVDYIPYKYFVDKSQWKQYSNLVNEIEKSNKKITRGGHCKNNAYNIRCSNRISFGKDINSVYFGFRLAFSNEPREEHPLPIIIKNKVNTVY